MSEGYSCALPCDSSWTRGEPLSAGAWGAERGIGSATFYSFIPIPMTSSKKLPIYHAFHVQDGYWTKIGAAWNTESGKALSVALKLLPPDGRFILAKPKTGKYTPSASAPGAQ